MSKIRIFIHGLEGSSQGTKAQFFKKRFPEMIIPDFRGALNERMEKLNDVLKDKDEIQIIGSSFGGLMAYIFALENEFRVDRLILLAPAINMIHSTNYKPRKIKTPAWIFHGIHDLVIPIEEVKSTAKDCFTNLHFETLEDDHVLSKNFTKIDWNGLLKD